MQTKVPAMSPMMMMMLGVDDRQEMINRHSLGLGRLRRASDEASSLRRENDALRSLNADLCEKLRLLIRSSLSLSCLSSPVIGGGGETTRSSLPKSISVKSDEYLKIDNGRRTRSSSSRSRSKKALHNVKQKVYVSRDREPVDIEVDKQGSVKTELCYRWQECGECPYGPHCRFAHDVDELRPVIRHPRYKTEVCRMVLAGVACPYGHRCHFRHAINARASLKPRPVSLFNSTK